MVGFTFSYATKALTESRGITLFLTSALEGGEGSASCPGRTLNPGKDPIPIVQEAGWASGPVWTGAENLALTGIRSRTVQPVGSRYTDYALLYVNTQQDVSLYDIHYTP